MGRPHSFGKMAQERRAKKRKAQQLRTGYVRPSRAKPKTGWTLAELAQMTAMRQRLLKRWLEMEILPRPPFRGVATRSGRQQLVWALAVRRMRAMDPAPLPKIEERLLAMSGEQVEAITREACPPGAAAEALGLALRQMRLSERRTPPSSTPSYRRAAPASAGGRASNWASAWSSPSAMTPAPARLEAGRAAPDRIPCTSAHVLLASRDAWSATKGDSGARRTLDAEHDASVHALGTERAQGRVALLNSGEPVGSDERMAIGPT